MGRALLHWCLSFWMGAQCFTNAFGPKSWSRGCNWVQRCYTASTTSQHHFLSGASSTFAGPYPGSCWNPSDLLTVHHVVRSAHRSLCSEGELSGLFLIIHRRIPIRASGFCMWGCGQWCLSILGAVRSLLPPKWAPYLDVLLFPT
jgi:hypothetical protein